MDFRNIFARPIPEEKVVEKGMGNYVKSEEERR